MARLLEKLLRNAGYVPAPAPHWVERRVGGPVGVPPLGHTPIPNYRWDSLDGTVIYGINANGDPREVSFTNPLNVASVISAGATAAYRSNLTVPDLIPNPGTVTGSAVAGGACTAASYNLIIVAKNQYGRTLGSTKVTVVTSGANLTVRGAFAAVAGATFYDVYLSVDTDPRWVGEISEAQRASGIVITIAGTATANCTTAAGGTAGAVDIQVPAGSTMPQSGTTAAQSTALLIPALNTAVDCTGRSQVRFNCAFTRSGDGASLAATVAPAFYDESDLSWYLGDPKTFIFGGTSGVYNSLKQALVFDVRGAKAHLLLLAISGTGASLTVNAVTS